MGQRRSIGRRFAGAEEIFTTFLNYALETIVPRVHAHREVGASAYVFAYRPPKWLLPRDNVYLTAPMGRDRMTASMGRDRRPSIVTALRLGLLTSLFLGGGLLFVQHDPPGNRSALGPPDYLFLGGCFVLATLIWWVLVAAWRR